MTKKLTEKEKRQRKEERRKSKQQKAPSPTVKVITQSKPESKTEPDPNLNLCDNCAYEFGECGGSPKFASEEGADDRVVECNAFVPVEQMPTADQVTNEATAGPGAAAEESEEQIGQRAEAAVEVAPDTERIDAIKARTVMTEARPDPKRFQVEEDFGACQSCDQPLKRTALNRYQDAVRCVNGRCRAYRVIVKTISTGVK